MKENKDYTNSLVSIIMNCHNGAEYLKDAISSVYDQTYQNWEIIFWDNASTDDSANIVRTFDKKIKYFKSSIKTSLGAARNSAISKAQGSLIAFLDVDDLWLPHKLTSQLPLFNYDDNIGLVFSDTNFFYDKRILKNIYSKYKPPRGYIFSQLLSNYFISLETVIVKREALESLETLFDERLSASEETDLFLRIAYKWKLDYVDEPLAKWRINENSFTHKNWGAFYQEIEIILDKLRFLISNFDSHYREQITLLEEKKLFQKSIHLWKDGKKSEARKIIFENSKKIKFILFYFITFMPKESFPLFLKIYFRIKFFLR